MASYAVVHRPRRYAVTRQASGGRTVARFGLLGPAGPTGASGVTTISDATALGALTDAVADALFLLASNAAGTAARKVAITAVVRAILQATTAAGVRAAIGAGTGDALTSGTLAQFAATTSAQLAGVLSDETGYSVGAVSVFSKSPTIETPVFSGNVTVSGGNILSAVDGGNSIGGAAANRFYGRFYGLNDGNVSNTPGMLNWASGTGGLRFENAGFSLGSATAFGWSGGDVNAVARDTGLARDSVGVVRATDGGAGTGTFLGGFRPVSMTDAAAANNTVYYSTTASKLVYKDAGGVVNALY